MAAKKAPAKKMADPKPKPVNRTDAYGQSGMGRTLRVRNSVNQKTGIPSQGNANTGLMSFVSAMPSVQRKQVTSNVTKKVAPKKMAPKKK
jgi:hypothetical protein